MNKKLTLFLLSGLLAGGNLLAQDQAKVGADLAAYMGLYSSDEVKISGTKEYTSASHLQSFSEGHLYFNGTKGNITGVFDLAQRTNNSLAASRTTTDSTGDTTQQTDNRAETIRYLRWNKEGLGFTLGTVTPAAANGYGLMGGQGTNSLPGQIVAQQTYVELDGLEVSYKGGGMDLTFGLWPKDALQDAGGDVEGVTYSLGALGDYGSLGFRLHLLSSTQDDHTGINEKLSSTGGALGLRYKMGEALSLSMDGQLKKVALSASTTKDTTENGLQVRYRLGVDELILGLAALEYKTASIKTQGETKANLTYDMQGFQLLYNTQTTSYENGADPITASYFGLGMVGSF